MRRLNPLKSIATPTPGSEVDGVTAAMAGRTIDALIEKPGRQAGQRVGRSPWLQPVIVDETAGEIGDIVSVRITRTGQTSLFAEPADAG